MFIPLHDKNALRFIPFQIVTVGLIAVNVAVYLWQQSLDEASFLAVVYAGGLTPTTLFGGVPLPPDLDAFPVAVTLFTHIFLHASWLHLIGNMVFLWVFGDNVEDAMGHARFLAFYVASGIAGGLAHAWFEPASAAPLIGASSATSGIIGAYLLLYPRVKVWVLMLMRIPLRLPALWALVSWVAFQAYFALSGTWSENAWWAHLGGFAAGLALTPFLRRPGVPLFGPIASPNQEAVRAPRFR